MGEQIMRIGGNDTDSGLRSSHAIVDAKPFLADPYPLLALAPMTRDILANAHHLPDAELMRLVGCLRTMADEVMAVMDRRIGTRPAPRLIVDNTNR